MMTDSITYVLFVFRNQILNGAVFVLLPHAQGTRGGSWMSSVLEAKVSAPFSIPGQSTTQTFGRFLTLDMYGVRYRGEKASDHRLLVSGTCSRWGDDGSGLDLDRAAAIVASAVGPSGPNVDYLRNLSSFLQAEGHNDPHISDLESRVIALISAKVTATSAKEAKTDSSP